GDGFGLRSQSGVRPKLGIIGGAGNCRPTGKASPAAKRRLDSCCNSKCSGSRPANELLDCVDGRCYCDINSLPPPSRNDDGCGFRTDIERCFPNKKRECKYRDSRVEWSI